MNLILNKEKWYTYCPPNLLSPNFEKENGLSITLPKDEYSLGKWICDLPIEAGKTYNLKAVAEGNKTSLDMWILVSTHKSDSSMHIREHAENVKCKNGVIEFSHTFEAAQDVVSAKIEFWLKGVGGRAALKDICLDEADAKPKREVSVCMAYINPYLANPKSLEKSLENILSALDNTAKYSPDIVVLSEGMYQRAVGAARQDYAEADDGKICKIIANKAKELNSYVVYNFCEANGRFYHNTSLLIDRNGNMVGKYRKTHLTVCELEAGLVPGNESGVFETDFGKIGLLTCWDQYFPRTAEALVEQGAEIIFVPTAGESGQKAFARAMDNGVYFAVSGVNGMVNNEDDYGWQPTRIISPLGNILAETNEHLESAHAVIDLNKKERSFWLSVGPAVTDSKGCYMFEKNPNL